MLIYFLFVTTSGFLLCTKVDLWIVPNDIYDPIQHEEQDEDSDDDSDEEDDETKEELFDIKGSLKDAQVPYHNYVFDEGRRLYEDYKQLKKDQDMKVFKQYPHNRRFCIIADRRNKKIEKVISMPDYSRNGDDIYIYHPPKGNEIPNDHLSEKFMQLSNECILPKSSKCELVNAKTASSQLFMLSFHVEAVDEIRCYLYQRGQISRFYPTVYVLFPVSFVGKTFVCILIMYHTGYFGCTAWIICI